MSRLLFCLLLFASACLSSATGLPRVLFFANPMSSDNDVVRRTNANVLSVAETNFAQLSKGIFDVTITQDGAEISAEKLRRYDAVVFFTAIHPPDADIDALMQWVKNGGAFVGIHSTANSYQNHRGFGELLGARYDRRPWRTREAPQTKVRLLVNDKTHPATRHLTNVWELADDIYLFKHFDTAGNRTLLSLDPNALDLSKGHASAEKAFPVAWVRIVGKGRVFYTALGDWEPTWKDQRYRTHLIEGIRWSMKKD